MPINSSELQILIRTKNKVIIKYSTSWCGPCRVIAPYYHASAKQFGDRITFLEVDVGESADVATTFNISGVPTFQSFHQGTMMEEFAGASKDKLNAMISKLIKG